MRVHLVGVQFIEDKRVRIGDNADEMGDSLNPIDVRPHALRAISRPAGPCIHCSAPVVVLPALLPAEGALLTPPKEKSKEKRVDLDARRWAVSWCGAWH